MLIFNAPKNFKSGRLIGGRYSVLDVCVLIGTALFSFGAVMTMISFFNSHNVLLMILFMLPFAIAFSVTTPFGIYHNITYLGLTILRYMKSRKNYYWEGIYKDDKAQ